MFRSHERWRNEMKKKRTHPFLVQLYKCGITIAISINELINKKCVKILALTSFRKKGSYLLKKSNLLIREAWYCEADPSSKNRSFKTSIFFFFSPPPSNVFFFYLFPTHKCFVCFILSPPPFKHSFSSLNQPQKTLFSLLFPTIKCCFYSSPPAPIKYCFFFKPFFSPPP